MNLNNNINFLTKINEMYRAEINKRIEVHPEYRERPLAISTNDIVIQSPHISLFNRTIDTSKVIIGNEIFPHVTLPTLASFSATCKEFHLIANKILRLIPFLEPSALISDYRLMSRDFHLAALENWRFTAKNLLSKRSVVYLPYSLTKAQILEYPLRSPIYKFLDRSQTNIDSFKHRNASLIQINNDSMNFKKKIQKGTESFKKVFVNALGVLTPLGLKICLDACPTLGWKEKAGALLIFNILSQLYDIAAIRFCSASDTRANFITISVFSSLFLVLLTIIFF